MYDDRISAEPVSTQEDFPLAILAKAPLPGMAKTRMIPALGAEGAARLQARLIQLTLATALESTPAANITLWTALDHQHPLFLSLADTYGITLRAQPSGDLGARMHHALQCMGKPGLLIGTDCPALCRNILNLCFQQLNHADSVFLPAMDGGYALVGVRRTDPGLFSDISWGTSQVMAQTRERLARLGWSLSCPAKVRDLDTPEDLLHLSHKELNSLEISL